MRAKEFLSSRNVRFELADIANDPAAMQRLVSLGVMRVPIVMSGERWVSGADLDAVAELLDLGPTGHRMLPLDVLYEKYDAILAATQRYLRVFPPEAMSMTVPRREKRDMRQLGYHVFAIADDLMTVKEGDEYTQGNGPIPDGVRTFEQIVAYGDEVRDRLHRWYSAQPQQAWEASLETSLGKFPRKWYFERATWHAAQHSRQIVEMLKMAGVQAPEPLPQAFFRGLPIPQQLWE